MKHTFAALLFAAALGLLRLGAAEPVEPSEPTYRLQAGALVAQRQAGVQPVQEAVRFADGTTLSPKGVLKQADGSTVQLREGDTVSATGRLQKPESTSATASDAPATVKQP